MNDLDLPPRRPLPPSVRARLRARLTPEVPRRARFRGPLAVAAGVAVLAAGAVMISQSVGDPDDFTPGEVPPATTTVPAPDPTLAPATLNGVLDVCVAAVDGDDYPPREAWQPVLGARGLGVTVVAARAEGKPYACQLTATSVTVSNPAGEVPQSPGTTAGLLLNTPEGVVAGVAEPAWRRVGVLAMDGTNSTTSTVASAEDGMFFLIRGSEELVEVRLYNVVGDNGNPPSWEATPPLGTEAMTVTVVNRNNSVAPEDWEAYHACAEANPSWDAENWSPAAGVIWQLDGRMVLLRNRYGIAVCRHDPKPADGREHTVTELGSHERGWEPCRLAALTPYADDPVPPLGAVVTPEAAYVDIWFDGRSRPIRKAAVNGTFVVQTPWPGAEIEKVDVYDKDSMKHSGPLDDC
jgi:hypothetical protein